MAARIAIIEDNPDNLELMRYLLAAAGHELIVAIDGLEGLGMLQRDPPDLILCDVQLPGIDGFELLRRVRADERLRALPMIAVTSLAMVGDRDKALEAGFDGYLSKPIDPMTFSATVVEFLRNGQEVGRG